MCGLEKCLFKNLHSPRSDKKKPVDDYRKRNVSEKNLDIGISCKWVTR